MPASRTSREPQSLVLLTLIPVRVLVVLALATWTLSMSRPAATLASSARVPVQTLAALAVSLRVSTVQSVPNAHSRTLLPATRSTLWVAPLAKLSVTWPTGLPSYHQAVLAELRSSETLVGFW